MEVSEIRKQGGAKYYAACVGKTSLDRDSEKYKTTVKMAEILLRNNVGVIHGGYKDDNDGGTMQAYAEGANNIIMKEQLKTSNNIGIPESRFDKKRGINSRTGYNTFFSDPYDHMDDRCGAIIDNSDFMVVNEVAGNGTLREVFTMYERNDMHKPNNLNAGRIKPIIFYGKNRKKLFKILGDNFEVGTRPAEDKMLYFVESIEEFETTIKNMVLNIL